MAGNRVRSRTPARAERSIECPRCAGALWGVSRAVSIHQQATVIAAMEIGQKPSKTGRFLVSFSIGEVAYALAGPRVGAKTTRRNNFSRFSMRRRSADGVL